MMELVKDITDLVTEILFPTRCTGCGAGDSLICTSCTRQFLPPTNQHCIACQRTSPFGLTDSKCKRPLLPSGLFACLDYNRGSLSAAIIAGKYNFVPEVFTELAKLMTERLKTARLEAYFKNNDYVIIPLPLAPSRKRWRGFNQAEVLAKAIADNLSRPYEEVLVRIRSTKTQKDLKKDERTKNVANAFALARDTNVTNKSFVLIDDVVTTGATLREATRVLLSNGAREVWCVALARD